MKLNPEKALIFRITHIANLPWILDHGLHCASSATLDPAFQTIGSEDLIRKRPSRPVPMAPGGTLADYIPFYFTPCSPMLFNILTGYNEVVQRSMSEIVVLVSSLHKLGEQGVSYLFTDRHAYLQMARFFDDVSRLDVIDWALLEARDFKYSPDDPGKMERYQAEALAHRHVPVTCLLGVGCYEHGQKDAIEQLVRERNVELDVVARPGWFFR
jgi:ssDNA thymidine ADP-ribosyltransferase, DarT